MSVGAVELHGGERATCHPRLVAPVPPPAPLPSIACILCVARPCTIAQHPLPVPDCNHQPANHSLHTSQYSPPNPLLTLPWLQPKVSKAGASSGKEKQEATGDANAVAALEAGLARARDELAKEKEARMVALETELASAKDEAARVKEEAARVKDYTARVKEEADARVKEEAARAEHVAGLSRA
eukprot:1191587-Prymnesium_polylepis.1